MSNTILNSSAFVVNRQMDAAFTPKSVAFIFLKEKQKHLENGRTENVFNLHTPGENSCVNEYPVYLIGPTGFFRPGNGKVFNYSSLTLVASKKIKESFWRVESINRGFIFEEMLQANLRKIKNYPVIDDFANGVATSIKTLALSTSGYRKNPALIYSKLKKYIDDLYKFNGVDAGDIDTFGKITSKKIELGIPLNATTEQVKMLEKAVTYAEKKHIRLNIRTVR